MTFKKKAQAIVEEAAQFSSATDNEREQLQESMNLFLATFNRILQQKTKGNSFLK